MQDRSLLKNVCFPNLKIVLEKVYVAQRIINSFFLHFCICKTNPTLLEFGTHIYDKDRHIWWKGQIFVFVEEEKISMLSNLTSFVRGALESP